MRRLDLETFEVGGCIRDELLGKEAKDIDFAVCGVTHEQLGRALSREGNAVENVVGGRVVGFRLFSEWAPPEGVEISLARVERSTSSGRANFEVELDPTLTIVDDLGRRDFTINAIARNIHTGELVDPFDGAADVASKTLRVIGEQSFAEDPSRILRGLVRIAKDGFVPDNYTLGQMVHYAQRLEVEPAEQIYFELDRMLSGPYAGEALRIGVKTGAIQVALPELVPIVGFEQESRYHDLTCDQHTFRVVEEACRAGASQVVRWAALFHDSGKPVMAWRGADGHLHFYANPDDPKSQNHETVGAAITRDAFNRLLQPPMDFRKDVIQLVAEHMYTDDRRHHPLRARRFIQRVGRDRVKDLLLLRRCDRTGKYEGPLDPDEDSSLRAWEELVESQLNQPLIITDLAINGHDAMAVGFKGVEIGALLKDVLRLVTDQPELNERGKLLSLIERRAIKEGKIESPA
jgi:tRNA nucleotidyltransferase (CCA-adding enzyme)